MREVKLEERIRAGERVPVLMKGVVHFVWHKPKEDFGFKHTLTFHPHEKNRICRSVNDLLFSMSEIDSGWSITEVVEEVEEIEVNE